MYRKLKALMDTPSNLILLVLPMIRLPFNKCLSQCWHLLFWITQQVFSTILSVIPLRDYRACSMARLCRQLCSIGGQHRCRRLWLRNEKAPTRCQSLEDFGIGRMMAVVREVALGSPEARHAACLTPSLQPADRHSSAYSHTGGLIRRARRYDTLSPRAMASGGAELKVRLAATLLVSVSP
jgi:hypothetical protein